MCRTLTIGLRRLRGDADARMRLEREHVFVVEDDVEAIEVTRQAAHFDVSALPDDHGVIPVADERAHGLVRDVDERAGRLDDLEPQRACPRQGTLGCAMRRHHHGRSS